MGIVKKLLKCNSVANTPRIINKLRSVRSVLTLLAVTVRPMIGKSLNEFFQIVRVRFSSNRPAKTPFESLRT